MPRLLPYVAQMMAGWDQLVHWLFSKARPSYLLISILQLKLLWKIWEFKDLTTGDTSSYFTKAYHWYENFTVDPIWSPLYTAFYGSIFIITQDVYVATILHRVIIVMAATLGVLAIMRAVLHPPIALMVAAWWAVMPINFNTLYEVHLFTLLPILAAWLVAAAKGSPWTRGTALAILVTATILVRNELIVADVFFALVFARQEINNLRQGRNFANGGWYRCLIAYAVPLAVALAVCGFFFWRSGIQYAELAKHARPKHTLNMCQVYAVGYQQRYGDWNLNPWLHCSQLMEKVFRQPFPGLYDMIRANPRAVWEHFAWNLSLIPNGLQIALFNAMYYGSVNPDYAPVVRVWWALAFSIVAIASVGYGALVAARDWTATWREWFCQRRDIWLIMIGVVCVAIPVILTQRPRPSYLFAVTVFLMAVIGSAIHIMTSRRPLLMSTIAIAFVGTLILVVPPFYVSDQSGRPLYTNYERLRPYAALMMNANNRILLGDYAGELRNYLLLGGTKIDTFDYDVLHHRAREQSLPRFLDEERINIFFVQPRIMDELRSQPSAREFLESPEKFGWEKVAPSWRGARQWMLLNRRAGTGPATTVPNRSSPE